MVCDLELFEIHTNFTGTAKQVYRFSLDDLLKNQATADCKLPPLEVLRAVFTDPARHSRGYCLRQRSLLIPVLDPGTGILEVLDVAGDDCSAVLDGMCGDFKELGDRVGVE